MEGYHLYHGTLKQNTDSIERMGLQLNRKKANRDIKGYTDLFNYIFNQKCGEYLPQRIVTRKVDRNSAIFLSANENEFRKTEHLSPDEKNPQSLEDVVYRCTVNVDLPAFDASLYDEWANKLKKALDANPLIKDYLIKSSKKTEGEIKLVSNLFKFLIYGDYNILGMPNNYQKSFEILRAKVIEYTHAYVKKYCENAVNATDILTKYEYQKEPDGFAWYLKQDEDKLPKKISRLEILCNFDMHPSRLERIDSSKS